MQKIVPTIFIFLSILVFLWNGCAPTIKISRPEIAPQPDSIIIEEQVPDDSDTITILTILDSLLIQADSLCTQGDFHQAHVLLIDVIHNIKNDDELPQKEMWNGLNNVVIRVAELYSSSFPQDYLDSVPTAISNIIFRYQISKTTDSLSFSMDDSSLLSIMECEEGLPYNIPIIHNRRVQNALYYIVTKRKRSMGSLLTRANYYLPFMQRFFAENDLPTDLVYLPILESGFNPKAYSYAHASGIWQFIPSTGRIYGLRRNYWIDERRDPIKSTNAAINYLKKLYGDFNDWYLALAAYNCGEGNVGRAIRRADTADYWQLKLPRETMNYVPQYIAYQIVGKNPQCFGFKVEQGDTFNLDTVHVSDCLDLNKIAEGLNITFENLKKINPQIRQWCTPPKMKDVTLYLPNGLADTFKVFYASLSEEDKVEWFRYRIKSGDNLLSIAHRFKISVPAIRSINRLKNNFIVAGRYLYIPIPINGRYPKKESRYVKTRKKKNVPIAKVFQKKGIKPIKYKVSSGETIADISKLFNIKTGPICRWNNISNPRRLQPGTVLKLYIEDSGSVPVKNGGKNTTKTTPPTPSPQSVYSVMKGETLYGIANKLGTTVDELAGWNNKDLNNPIIKPGEQLKYHKKHTKQNKNQIQTTGSTNSILYKVRKGDNLSLLADLFSVSINRIMQLNNLTKNSIIKPGDLIHIPDGKIQKKSNNRKNNNQFPGRIVYYKVQKGDNLWTIADLFDISLDTIFKANNLNKNSVLMPGDTLRIILPEES